MLLSELIEYLPAYTPPNAQMLTLGYYWLLGIDPSNALTASITFSTVLTNL